MDTLQHEVMINGMRLRNRIALPPVTTNYYQLGWSPRKTPESGMAVSNSQ
jgi:2,4-dienoyl-CoA reductase-like NADH-dependent reductase (Old Yellow Enzyme family)